MSSTPTTTHVHSFKNGLIDLTSGSCAGVAVVYVGQPLDTVKVKMQTFPQLYNGMLDCLKKTYKSDGLVRGLYAGTLPAIIANVGENAVLFPAYGFCQFVVCRLMDVEKPENLTTFGKATAGGMAAFFSSFVLCPTELVKCRLQAMREVSMQASQTAVQITPFQLTYQILKTNGIPGLYKGFVPTVMREMPGYFGFFGGYEGTRYYLAKPGQSKDDIGLFRTMIAGSVGGACLWLIIFPSDLIKSRIQISHEKQTFLKLGFDIVQNEGVLGLFNGLKPTLIRAMPATAVLFAVFENTKKFLHYLLD